MSSRDLGILEYGLHRAGITESVKWDMATPKKGESHLTTEKYPDFETANKISNSIQTLLGVSSTDVEVQPSSTGVGYRIHVVNSKNFEAALGNYSKKMQPELEQMQKSAVSKPQKKSTVPAFEALNEAIAPDFARLQLPKINWVAWSKINETMLRSELYDELTANRVAQILGQHLQLKTFELNVQPSSTGKGYRIIANEKALGDAVVKKYG